MDQNQIPHHTMKPSSNTEKMEHSQDEFINHELEEFINTELSPSLPREKGWWTVHLYQYQGFWYTPIQLQGLMPFQQHFQARDTDIILASSPKTGTTWLKSLVFAIMNRRRETSTNQLLTTNPHGLVPFLEFDMFGNKNNFPESHFPDLSSIPSPRVLATHVPYPSLAKSILTSNCRIVYISRNPKDNLVSYWHFTNTMGPKSSPLSFEEAHELFCRGVSPYGPVWDHVLGYWKESLERPNKVLFVKYEDLKGDIRFQLKRLADYLGCPFSQEEESEGEVEEIVRMCSFEHLKNLEINKTGKVLNDLENKNYFRKGEVGGWVSHFTPLMAEQLDQVTKEKLCGSGLTFEYVS